MNTVGSLCFLLLCIFQMLSYIESGSYNRVHMRHLRDQVVEMFNHAYYSYKNFAFPLDELDPIQCQGIGLGGSEQPCDQQAILGGYSLTLIDSLDTLAIMGKREEFRWAVQYLSNNLNFNIDMFIDVFEVNIRVLGGLLSAHLIIVNDLFNMSMKSEYADELLTLATDLGDRLLHAWDDSPTDLPYSRINLKTKENNRLKNSQTNLAAAGTLILEFSLLSKLTNNPIYEKKALDTLYILFAMRSDYDLLGNTIDVNTGKWNIKTAGIGAGQDSFYEYLLKGSILVSDDLFGIFEKLYKGIMTHVRSKNGFWYLPMDMDMDLSMENLFNSLGMQNIDGLAAFFPGLQVLYGDIKEAIRHYMIYYMQWCKYGALPETFSSVYKLPVVEDYLQRPEIVESTYVLYRATKDPFFLNAGEKIMNDINEHLRTDCGFAPLKSVFTKAKNNQMNSFFLAETLKYLYLLFDTDNELHGPKEIDFVFTTEGHIFYNSSELKSKLKNTSINIGKGCKIYPKSQFSSLSANYYSYKDRQASTSSSPSLPCRLFPIVDAASEIDFSIVYDRRDPRYNPYLWNYNVQWSLPKVVASYVTQSPTKRIIIPRSDRSILLEPEIKVISEKIRLSSGTFQLAFNSTDNSFVFIKCTESTQ